MSQLAMTDAQYIEERLDNQYQWHSKKSSWNQQRYKSLRSVVLVVSVLIPFLSGLMDRLPEVMPIVVGVAGVIVAVCEGLIQINKYHENWTNYRLIAESLKRESYLYKTQSGPYANNADQSLSTLVARVENILGEENKNWLGRMAETTD